MTRRGNREGTIRQRPNGLWEARASQPNGRRASAYAATREEAAVKLRELQQSAAQGLIVTPGKLITGDYLAQWLQQVRPSLRESTWRRYRSIVEGILNPTVGRVKLAQLSPSDVGRMMAAAQRSGRSAQTAAHCRAVLRTALADAMREGLLVRNVAAIAKPPHLPAPEPTVLRAEQALQVVAAMGDGQLGRLVVVALHSGVRLGELLGLRWDDLTLDGATPELRVAQTVQWRPGEYVAVEPKSRRSRRTLPLTREAVAALAAQRQAQREARLAAGPRWQPIPALGELVFTTTAGRPLSGPLVTRQFQQGLAAAGLAKLRFHDIRAASGALLLSAGVDIAVVSRRLGHSGIGVTASRYAGVADQLQREASERLQALLEDGR